MQLTITKLHYRIALSSLKHSFGRERNIVIHHGLMGSAKNFRSLSKQPQIAQHANSFLLDARNHGDSPHTPTHTIPQLAQDLYEYLEANSLLEAEKSLTLMGHSMGGLALMEFTKRYAGLKVQKAIEGVILIDVPASPLSSRPSFQQTGNMLKRMLEIDLSLPLSQIHREIQARAISKDVAGLLKADIIRDEHGLKWRVNLKVLANEGYANIGAFSLSQNNPAAWTTPVHLIYGQLSGYVTPQELQLFHKYYPRMAAQNQHKITGAGHWVHYEQPEIFLQTVQKILSRKPQL